jgi:hypothetical protein
MGTFHDEHVLLIKTAMGNRSLGFDFRPPSSGRSQPADDFEGAEYRLMVQGVRETLDDIAKVVPGYRGQGYEIAGFGWFLAPGSESGPKSGLERRPLGVVRSAGA